MQTRNRSRFRTLTIHTARFAFAFATLPFLAAGAVAQIPTPTPMPGCSAAPRTTLPAFDGGTPYPLESLGSSVPADPETVAAIEATAVGLVACVNAGDTARYLAYYSDRFLASGRFAVTEADLQAPPTAVPTEQQSVLLGIFYVRQYASGDVGAILALDNPAIPSPVQPIFLIFTKSGNQWLIDDWPETFDFE